MTAPKKKGRRVKSQHKPERLSNNSGPVLYRQFDKDRRLLYIGKSVRVGCRYSLHFKESHWFRQVTTTEFQWFDNATELGIAEIEAIQKEKPLYNIAHNRPLPSSLPTRNIIYEVIMKRFKVDLGTAYLICSRLQANLAEEPETEPATSTKAKAAE
jgi:hypothetical protein